MEKRYTLLIAVLFLFFTNSIHAQTLTQQQQKTVDHLFKKKGEICFKFTVTTKAELTILTKIISIDDFKNNEVFAYANKQGFEKFLLLNYSYTIMPNPNTLNKVKMGKNNNFRQAQTIWNAYPTYPQYETIMQQFVTDHPTICKLYTIATL